MSINCRLESYYNNYTIVNWLSCRRKSLYGTYHLDFGDGADADDEHGDSDLNWRTCQEKNPTELLISDLGRKKKSLVVFHEDF